jgi:hypothetical protein
MEYTYGKKERGKIISIHISYPKQTLTEWIINKNVKYKTMKFQEKVGENLYDCRLGKEVSDAATKV